MKDKEKYVFDPHGAHPHDAYAQFAKELGGTWDGQELKIKTDWCKIEAYSFEFLNEFIIAILGMESDRSITTRHSSLSKEKTITIRLGLGATYKSNGTVKKFNNAGILILNSTQIHDFEFPAGEWSQWVSIRFSLNFFRKFAGNKKYKLKELFENDSPWINYYSQNAEIESRVRALIKNLDKKHRKHTFFFTKAMEIVELLKGKIENDADKFKSSIHPEDLKLMLELRDTHLSDFTVIPNLTELSDKYGMSVSKLNRLFKSIFDKPILQFYNQQKLEEAHRQIVYTNKSLTEIAIDLNFSHVGHMSSSFKNHFGYAPSALKGKHMDYLS